MKPRACRGDAAPPVDLPAHPEDRLGLGRLVLQRRGLAGVPAFARYPPPRPAGPRKPGAGPADQALRFRLRQPELPHRRPPYRICRAAGRPSPSAEARGPARSRGLVRLVPPLLHRRHEAHAAGQGGPPAGPWRGPPAGSVGARGAACEPGRVPRALGPRGCCRARRRSGIGRLPALVPACGVAPGAGSSNPGTGSASAWASRSSAAGWRRRPVRTPSPTATGSRSMSRSAPGTGGRPISWAGGRRWRRTGGRPRP